jgi:hypothetical protein
MAKRYMTVSDLTGDPIHDDQDIVTIVVHDHPLIERPVQLDADAAEVSDVKGSDKDFAIIELIRDGGDKRERLVLELSEFEGMFNGKIDVDDVLHNAEPYNDSPVASATEPKRRGRPRSTGTGTPKADKVDYKTLEHAGTPHRGRTTEDEARIVRENLETVNKRRVEQGYPAIDPKDPKDAARYGFDQ